MLVEGQPGAGRYTGMAHFAPGEWVGVCLDEPIGKNDGTVRGMRYFKCRPNYGLFVNAGAGLLEAADEA